MAGALRPALQRILLRAWTGRSWLACLLWPVSLVFCCLVWLRRQLYRHGFFNTQRVNAITIVVGNVVAGGAGKTPTVMALVHHLRAQGLGVGVVSRGYGRHNSMACVEVQEDSRPGDVGDEPLLIRRSCQVPVFVGPTRIEAATALLARHPQTRVIICDDGLQHYGLHRDLEICVFDDRGCGNGWYLPAGPLREGWPRRAVARVGQRPDRLLVLHTGSQPAFAGYTAQRSLAPFAVGRDGVHIPLEALRAPGNKPLMAVAGIAQPEAFFAMLRALALPLAHSLALPDHYAFDSASTILHGGYRLICTEKDAAKLWPLAPDALAVPLVFAPEAAFFSALDAALAPLLSAKLSSAHGHPTT
ncbi:MAG: tetraacyldisaccharide 4'-kinase [Pseudomonadota bacterium]